MFGAWVTGLPARLVHLAESAAWPWLPLAVVAAAVLAVAGRAVHTRLWRDTVAAGVWVRIVPPRLVATDPATTWRLLATLARRTHSGWRLAKPPLSFEIHNRGGRLTAGLWLPTRVPFPVVAAEVARVWPGATVEQTDPPALDGDGQLVAGCRLVSTAPDTGPLVDDLHLTRRQHRAAADGDPLQAVLAALNDRHGPGLVQVLVRPAPGRRVGRLRDAARHPAAPRRGGAALAADGLAALLRGTARLLAELVTEMFRPSRSHHRVYVRHRQPREGHRPLDAVQRERMRDAAAKLRHGPHLIATIRVGVARTDRGWARGDARHVGDGYAAASGVLYPARLPRAARVLAQRRARRSHWLLVTPAELGVLAHLPAQPGRYGFDTAALHRPYPGGSGRAAPERAGRGGPGWTRTGWTTPPHRVTDVPAPPEEGWDDDERNIA